MHSTENELVTESEAQAAAIAIRNGSGLPGHYLLLGWFLDQRGDRLGAQALFQEALERDPSSFIAHLSLARVLREAGNLRQAAIHCDAAIATDPAEVEAWYERGLVMMAGGVSSDALACFTTALNCDAQHYGARAALAQLAARAGHADSATRHSIAVIAQEPGNAGARRALAMVALEAGDYGAALAHLEIALKAASAGGPDRIDILTLIGETHEKAGAPQLAELAYIQANNSFISANAQHFQDRESNAARIDALRRGFETALTAHPAAWTAPAADNPSGLRPVFVLGHPRSGNTLLENVLATVPGASALEERPTLRAAELRFFSEAGMIELAQAPTSDLDDLRAAYRAAVIQNEGDPDAPLLVDMDPMKSLRLPIIARLFPEARVLLVRRDPRDVVWSCYRTYFALTNAALDFATLEGAARHYAATMTLAETVRAALPLAVQVVRYEDLVADFDETTRAIADFLAIPWSQEFRRFDKAARERGVSTASERQVRLGLFDGRRQWQAHEEFMRPVEPILAPWIDRLGYR